MSDFTKDTEICEFNTSQGLVKKTQKNVLMIIIPVLVIGFMPTIFVLSSSGLDWRIILSSVLVTLLLIIPIVLIPFNKFSKRYWKMRAVIHEDKVETYNIKTDTVEFIDYKNISKIKKHTKNKKITKVFIITPVVQIAIFAIENLDQLHQALENKVQESNLHRVENDSNDLKNRIRKIRRFQIATLVVPSGFIGIIGYKLVQIRSQLNSEQLSALFESVVFISLFSILVINSAFAYYKYRISGRKTKAILLRLLSYIFLLCIFVFSCAPGIWRVLF